MKRTKYIYKHIAAVATSLLLLLSLFPSCSEDLLSLFPSCSEDDGGGVEVDKYRTLVITLNSLEGALPVTRAEDVTTGENDTQYERHIDKYWLVMLKQSETGTGEFLVDQVIVPESPKYTKPSNMGLNSETELEVEVEIGKTYKFYALANLDGLQNGEDIIEQIEGLKQGNPFDPASLAVKVKEMSAYHDGEGGSYIPMTSYGYEQTITENTHQLDKSIELIRLIGKVTLTVKNLSKDDEITLKSLSMGDFRTEGNIYLFPYDVNKGTQILLQTNIDDTYNPTFPNNEEGKHTSTTFAENKTITKGENNAQEYTFYVNETRDKSESGKDFELMITTKIPNRNDAPVNSGFSFVRRNDWLKIPIQITDVDVTIGFDQQHMPIGGLPEKLEFGNIAVPIATCETTHGGDIIVTFSLDGISSMENAYLKFYKGGEYTAGDQFTSAVLVSNLPENSPILIHVPENDNAAPWMEDNTKQAFTVTQGEADEEGHVRSGSFTVTAQELASTTTGRAEIELMLLITDGTSEMAIPYTVVITNQKTTDGGN